MLLKNLEQDGVDFISNEKIIKEQYSFDLLQGDIPFFTEINDVLYYGTPERGIKIGKRA